GELLLETGQPLAEAPAALLQIERAAGGIRQGAAGAAAPVVGQGREAGHDRELPGALLEIVELAREVGEPGGHFLGRALQAGVFRERGAIPPIPADRNEKEAAEDDGEHEERAERGAGGPEN